jgi:hypothetical protein
MTVNLATGSAQAPHSERGLDLYETPPEAVRALLAVEPVSQMVWEPACGPGAIVRVLRESGRTVLATDLVDWGCPDSQFDVDFLAEREAPAGVGAIVTNPPFKLANEFAAHAIKLVPEVHMLMRGAFLEGMRWYRPEETKHGLGLRDHLARVWMFAPRLPFMHRHGYEGKKNSSSAMPFAWFVFHRNAAKFNAAQVRWVNPRDYQSEDDPRAEIGEQPKATKKSPQMDLFEVMA